MGAAFSLTQNFGVPAVQSITTDRFINTFYEENIDSFDKFHIAFVKLCDAFNSIIPGKRVRLPPKEKIEKCHKEWLQFKKDASKTDDQKKKLKELLIGLLEEHVLGKQKEDGLIILTGMVAPASSMVLKRAGENTPQLKKFRLNLIPDAVFVPSFTVLALIGVKMLQINMKTPARL